MKKIFLFIALFYSISFGQEWSNVWTIGIEEPTVFETKLFTNKDGNHLLLMRDNGNIVYYNFSLSGTVNTEKTITLATNGTFPNIVGSNDKIYALYKSGNFIKGKYSTNGGSSWLNLPDVTTTANWSGGVDAVYQDILGVHLVWATKDNGYNYETYYQRLDINSNQWVEYYPVTNYGTDVGGQPKVTFSTNRVHVCYGTGSVKTRDRFSGTWQTPQPVINPPEESYTHNLVVAGNLLYFIFGNQPGGPSFNPDMDISTKNRILSSSVWPSNTNVAEFAVQHFTVTKTYDNNLHLMYMRSGLFHEFFNGSIWSPDFQFTQVPAETYAIGFSSRSNDLYAVLKTPNVGNLKYCLYDAAPLAPQNLTAQATADYHPKLIWNSNTEADIQKYYVYRSTYNGGYTSPIATVTHNSSTFTQSYIDNSITVPRPGGQAGAKYYYVVSAVDIGQYVSGYSNYIEVTSDYLYWEKRLAEYNTIDLDFNLDQNFPNPFNPSTKISYSIKKDGLVTVRVYDILGKEIATLVNENKPAGNYEVEFNASSLPSGMYIYKLQAGSFVQTRKMLLMK